jgi:hypothetical protein
MNSTDEFFESLRGLLNRWRDEDRPQLLSRVLPACRAMNGLTDGWAHLYDGLVEAKALGPDSMTPQDWAILDDLIETARKVVFRR